MSTIPAVASTSTQLRRRGHRQRSEDHATIDIDNTTNPQFPTAFKESLSRIVKDQDSKIIEKLGGIKRIAHDLNSDPKRGIPGDADDLRIRRQEFSSNITKYLALAFHSSIPPHYAFCLYHFLITLNAVTIIAYGLLTYRLRESLLRLFDLVCIFLCKIKKKKKKKSSSNHEVSNVFRNGQKRVVSVNDLVVGDVVVLTMGDQIPVDGLFLVGHGFQVEVLSFSPLKGNEVVVINEKNPFLSANSMVVDGYAHMLVTSVLRRSRFVPTSDTKIPIVDMIDRTFFIFELINQVMALIFLIVMLVRCLLNGKSLAKEADLPKVPSLSLNFLSFGKNSLFLVLSTDMLGLSVALLILLVRWGRKMNAMKAEIQHIPSIMTIPMIGTIIINQEHVLKPKWDVIEFRFSGEPMMDEGNTLPPKVLHILQQAVGLNSLINVTFNRTSSKILYQKYCTVISSTEEALFHWAVRELEMDMVDLNESFRLLEVDGFNHEKKWSHRVVVVRDKHRHTKKPIHVHWKGDAQVILDMCSSYYENDGIKGYFTDMKRRKKFQETISEMERNGILCIAFAHKQMTDDEHQEGNIEGNNTKLLETDLTFVGLVGMKQLSRPEVSQVVEACRDVGLNIKMITENNISVARSLAIECGVLDSQNASHEAVIKGKDFHKMLPAKRIQVMDRVCVVAATTSSHHKLLILKCLEQQGHMVAFIGFGTKDTCVLKEANVGISMSVSGSIVDKESTDIVILDDSLSLLLDVIVSARCAYYYLGNLLHLHLTMKIVWFMLSFVKVVFSFDVAFTEFQQLWLEMFVGVMGGLALDETLPPPIEELLLVSQNRSLMSSIIWRNLIAQALYQFVVILTLQLKGEAVFSVKEENVRMTLAFNTCFLCQVFNVLHVKKLIKNIVHKGIKQNQFFWCLMGFAIVLQVVLMHCVPSIFETERLNWVQWGICFGIAVVSLPVAWVAECLPVPEKLYLGSCFPLCLRSPRDLWILLHASISLYAHFVFQLLAMETIPILFLLLQLFFATAGLVSFFLSNVYM